MPSFISLIKAACVLVAVASSVVQAATREEVQRLNPRKLQCRFGVLKRKEWRTLKPQEKADYIAGLQLVMKRSGSTTLGFYDMLARTHYDHNSYIHGNPLFLPWHRYFTVYLEQEIQRVTNKPIALPYWDWDQDSQAPEFAQIWDPSTGFGGDGRGSNNCIATGPFANYQALVPDAHCLARNFGFSDARGSFGAVVGVERISSIISGNRDYDDFRQSLEADPHGNVHVNINGDMGVMYSPNDPVFFLHHTKVDKIWWDWQQAHRDTRYAYNGQQSEFTGARGRRGNRRSAKLEDKLTPYNDWRVVDTFDTENLCFTYADVEAAELVQKLPPPKFVAPPSSTTPVVTVQPTVQPVIDRTEPVVQPSQPSRPSRPSRPERSEREEKKEHHHGFRSGIKDFFKSIFNEAPGDLANAPLTPGQPAPADKTVKVVPASEAPLAPNDRKELLRLRKPGKLPERWVIANGLDPVKVAQLEKQTSDLIDKLNGIPGFISSTALWNQPNKVEKIFEAKVTTHFTATIKKGSIKVDAAAVSQTIVGAEKLQVVSEIKSRVKVTLGVEQLQDVESVREEVEAVMGKSTFAPTSAHNPLHPRHVKELSKSAPSTL